ncbi:MAG: polysaccharide deacetylase family protein [Streptosporangiaceae bacterium]|jgi:peptidoglycan/xylan/chitin deacetylase (PgdA/CDA1 family)
MTATRRPATASAQSAATASAQPAAMASAQPVIMSRQRGGGLHRADRVSGDRVSLRNAPMILMYHGVGDVREDPNHLFVTPDRFAEQMTWLARRGLRGVSVAALLDAMRAGEQRGLVGITFDDGYASVLAALPELQRHAFTASFYIISTRLGGTNEWDDGPSWPLLSAGGVTELSTAGMEVGSHGATHVRLAGLSASQLETEIVLSRAVLASLISAPVRGFAYPYGSMDAAARRAVRAAGYEYACAVDTPASQLGLMALPRVYVGQQDSAARFAVKRRLYKGYIAVRGKRS